MYGYYNGGYNFDLSNDNATRYDSMFEEAATIYDDYESQALEIYRIYCKQSCTQEFEELPTKYCELCYCDVACNYYGDCCPDYHYINNSKIVDHVCEPTSIPAHGLFSKYVTECPKDFRDGEPLPKCVETSPDNWRSMQVVSDPDTNVTYRNKYCAECHGVDSPALKWDIGIYCERDPPKPPFNRKEDVYLAAVKEQSCQIEFIRPDSIPFRPCGNTVSYPRICNATGLWGVYDPLIERGCLTFPENQVRYHTNIFCYMCNTYLSWEVVKAEAVGREPNVFRVTLTSLLELGEDDEDDSDATDDDMCQVTDPYTCDCRNPSCSEEKEYKDGKCKSVYKVARSHLYTLNLYGRLVFNESDLRPDIESDFLGKFMYRMESFNVVIYLCTYKPTYVSSCGQNTSMTILFTFVCRLYFREPRNTDVFEQEMFSLIDNDLNLTMQYQSLKLAFGPVENNFFRMNIDDKSSCKDYPMYLRQITTLDYSQDVNIESFRNVELTRLLSCPRVHLSVDETILSTDNKTLTIKATNKTIATPDFSQDGEGRFIVCLDDYLDAEVEKLNCDFDRLTANTTKTSPKITALGILSGICTCLSVLFLLITLVIFCLFKSMRTSIGLGIMALCLSLLVAQILFEFGAEQTEIKWVCEMIGIATHFSWLTSTFWMNVCTVSLFYKLNFPMESRHISKRKMMAYSILYCFGCSAMIIGALALGSWLNDGSLGYGGSSCYISGSNGRRLGFALPVGLLVLTNIILFAWTFIKLKRHQKIQSTQENQISMMACLKLSVITGLTWVFAFLFEATGFIVFAYLFTLFVGAQGFVIFLAFVFNRRVLKLLKIRYGFAIKKNTQSQQSISKNDPGLETNLSGISTSEDWCNNTAKSLETQRKELVDGDVEGFSDGQKADVGKL
ncbi:hypothetical protein LOTGIDRAFT_158106 [Lottia gigantea]|uniref:G-protein coupled receptors family 2 profile 2 domain-containing protein n=1 Tax=Lottia gigantea TaxID=225164 RepID=V4CDG3_LOTGI|nr:hypothetical protein LOTGIDRAFT_158106 [Lottia gigantea]ESO99944.1 hypothetical protein LOTGIDRAFT_158106 [Lottia gigantea]